MRSPDYDAEERDTASPRFCRNPIGAAFADGLPRCTPREGHQPFAAPHALHPIPQKQRAAMWDLFRGFPGTRV